MEVQDNGGIANLMEVCTMKEESVEKLIEASAKLVEELAHTNIAFRSWHETLEALRELGYKASWDMKPEGAI